MVSPNQMNFSRFKQNMFLLLAGRRPSSITYILSNSLSKVTLALRPATAGGSIPLVSMNCRCLRTRYDRNSEITEQTEIRNIKQLKKTL